MNKQLTYQVSGGFGAIASAFVVDSLHTIIPWLLGMFFIILCDLFAGVWCCLRTGVKLRFSKGCRDTIAKSLVYFAAVVACCWIEMASGTTILAKSVLLFICFIEICSIISNILRPKGYKLDLGKALRVLLKKLNLDDMGEALVEDEIVHNDQEKGVSPLGK